MRGKGEGRRAAERRAASIDVAAYCKKHKPSKINDTKNASRSPQSSDAHLFFHFRKSSCSVVLKNIGLFLNEIFPCSQASVTIN